MKKLIAIGEALIDFIPAEKGVALKNVVSFERVCGGAPTNVAAAYAKLGGKAAVLTQLGADAFGDYLVDTMKQRGIDVSLVARTDKANTALAFVSLDSDGNRDFSFYRNPSADMLLDKSSLKKEWFSGNVLHFCSVDLVECPMKHAHTAAINFTHENGGLVSFDPNLRFPLWQNKDELRSTVLEYCKYADVLKVSDDETEFLIGETDPDKAAKLFLEMGAKLVLISRGAKGARAYTAQTAVNCDGFKENAVDTTGAGDIFTGTMLYLLAKENSLSLTKETLSRCLEIACKASSLSVKTKGADYSLPDLLEVYPDLAK